MVLCVFVGLVWINDSHEVWHGNGNGYGLTMKAGLIVSYVWLWLQQ